MIIDTNNLSIPQNLTYLTSGEWGDVFVRGNRVFKAIYLADSTFDKLNQIRLASTLQNTFPNAPKVYSLGMRLDGRIWIEMDYLQGYQNIEDVPCNKILILSLIKQLQQANISHNDVNSRNIMTNGSHCMLVDWDDATSFNNKSMDSNLITRIANFYGV